jgi:transcriptional regulator with XRE-family HTH domain
MKRATFTDAFGARLREARKHHHVSQQEIAEAIGVSKVTISNIELGKTRRVEPALLAAFARFYSVTTSRFIEYLTGPPKATSSFFGDAPLVILA